MRTIGRYKLERRLGYGGMAQVWAAYDSALKHRVAVETVSGHRPGSWRSRDSNARCAHSQS